MGGPQRRAARPSSDDVVERVRAQLSRHAVRWVDGGSASRWEPVHGRFAKPVGAPDKRPQVVFTRVPRLPSEPAIAQWIERQRRLLAHRPDPGSGPLVFTRMAVRSRAFAVTSQPEPDLAPAIEQARELVERAAHLRVILGFFDHELVPAWVVVDGDRPVLLGLPQHHLVPTLDPDSSLAAVIGRARVRTSAHEVTPD